MSLDKSLKGKDTLQRHRNVLRRAERIDVLKELGRWTDDSTALGLPKVAHRKVSVGKKGKDKTAEDATAAPGAAGAATAAPADAKDDKKAEKKSDKKDDKKKK
jgi:small basic protein (TIGR04137 family)